MLIFAISINLPNVPDDWISDFYDHIRSAPVQELLILDVQDMVYIFIVGRQEDEILKYITELLKQKTAKNDFSDLQIYRQTQVLDLYLDIASGTKYQVDNIDDTLAWLKERFNIAMNKNATGPILAKIYHTALDYTQKIYDRPEMAMLKTTSTEVIYDIAQKISEDISKFQVLVFGDNKDLLLEIGQVMRKQSITRIFHYSGSDQNHYDSVIQSGCVPIDKFGLAGILNRNSILINVNFDNDILWELINEPVIQQKSLLFIYFQYSNALVPKAMNKLSNVFVQKYDHITGIIELYQNKRTNVLASYTHERETLIDEFSQWMHSDRRFQFSGIVSQNREMQKIFELIRRIARVDINVLISGQTGTGKELIARAIHHNSKRSHGKFIAVNCSAIPETLLEAELFGHEKGAFTGAISQKRGMVELAHGGTLFLDEIGDIPPPIQVKLLRVLQEREILRLGNPEPISVDVRLVAATNRDLQSLIEDDKFRTDLYFRVNTVQIKLPNLASRSEDIPLLIRHFIEKMNILHGKSILDVNDQVREKLQTYHWPGNVRELENVIEHAVAVSVGNRITLTDLPAQIQSPPDLAHKQDNQATNLKYREADFIKQLLEQENQNYSQVAKLLGISRTTLWRKVKEYNLS